MLKLKPTKTILVTATLIWLLLFYGSDCFSQNQHRIDSLVNSLKTEKEDSSRVKTLNVISSSFLTADPDKALEYANKALALAEKTGSKIDIIKSYKNIAGYFYYKGDLKMAKEYTQKRIPIIKQINNKKSLGEVYSNLSSIAIKQYDFTAALAYADSSLQIAEALKDSDIIALNYENKGVIYQDIAAYSTALNYFLEALKISQGHNNKSAMSNIYFNIAGIYRLMYDNTGKPVYYTQLSLKAARECNNQAQVILSLQRLGDIYHDKKQFGEALTCFQQALSIAQSMDDMANIGSCTRNIGLIYSENGEYSKAISSLLNALDISQNVGDKAGECTAYGYLGEVYMKQKDYKTAVSFLEKSMVISRQVREKNNESCALDDLSKCYKELNDFKQAFNYSTQYAALRDSILNEASINKTTEMEARYSLDKKEKEIALLTKDKQIEGLEVKKQTFLKNGFITGLILVCVLFFFIYYNYRTRQMLKLQTLRNKIATDLHDDVGSTLSSISIFSEIARQQSSEVAPMLQQISENSHKMLESMADIVWTINPENDNFEKIILRMRSFAFELLGAKKIDFEFNADESISKLNLPMNVRKNLYLIFKEATNNLVKYSDANRASFSISSSKNNLTLLIRDNGRGFNIEKPADGNGLKNMKNRAIEIGAKFLIESEPGTGTTIQLLIKVA